MQIQKSQMKLYIFNPESDLALANGDENYMPPLSVRKMATDLSFLPLWYAQTEAYILTKLDGISLDKLYRIDFQNKYPIKESDLQTKEITEVLPWSWNPALIKSLKQEGVSGQLLPTPEKMNLIRELSHRSTAIRIHKELCYSANYCGSPTELFSEEKVYRFFLNNPQCILKAPLSGSGRGLFICKGEYNYFAQQWVKNTLHKQKSIIGEPLYKKIKDFAMQFYSDGTGNNVSFLGYSLFHTDNNGQYKGNFLASNEAIENTLIEYIPKDYLKYLKEELPTLISSLLGNNYKGFLGIDMMVCQFEEKPFYRIHPCVEINLRTNMGIISRNIYDNYVHPEATGEFTIDYYSSSQKLKEEHEWRIKNSPLTIEEGRIKCGYISLVPVLEDTKYIAYVEIFDRKES